MQTRFRRTICALGVFAAVLGSNAAAHAGSSIKSPEPPSKRPAMRSTLFQIDEGLPAGGYLKLGRFKVKESTESNLDWLSLQSSWRSVSTGASVDRTFMAVEAGAKKVGVRGFVSAPGQSRSGELEPRLTASVYRRIDRVGPATNLVATASAGTGRNGERRYYAFTGASRFSLGPVSVLGHTALVDTELANGFKRSWNARAEAGLLVARRLDTKLAYEWLDPNDERRGDERARIGLRVDPVLERNVKVGVCYRNVGDPTGDVAANNHEVAFELNVTF